MLTLVFHTKPKDAVSKVAEISAFHVQDIYAGGIKRLF